MSVFIQRMISKAQAHRKTIVLPESEDTRTLKAAEQICKEHIADLIILGDKSTIDTQTYHLEGAHIVNPATDPNRERYAEALYELRKHKGITLDQAQDLLDNELYYGAMMVKLHDADGMVSGACHATSDVMRAGLQVLKTAPGISKVSTFLVMAVPDCVYGDQGLFIFSDCGLEIQPDEEALANIAVGSAQSWKTLIGTEPYVALLSHSTFGSAAQNADRDKVIAAVKRAHQLDPKLNLDGEMQLDAAIVPQIAQLKAPDSPVAGRANVLIFPDLDAGNIGYKLVQRLAKAEAYGPITQGMAAPINDLSRGCSAEDIVGVVAITCVQAQTQDHNNK